jgi:hypothetical protein
MNGFWGQVSFNTPYNSQANEKSAASCGYLSGYRKIIRIGLVHFLRQIAAVDRVYSGSPHR